MNRIIVCIRGRCSTWGKSWNRHLWTIKEKVDDDNGNITIKVHKSDTCFRCDMTKKEARND